MRLSFGASEPQKLRDAYLKAFPSEGNDPPSQRLSEFLAQDAMLNQFFEISYAWLEETNAGVSASRLEQTEGKRLLQSLIHIDFVDAQRNIDDDEGHRSTRLSNAFAGFYRSNLEQAEAAAEAQQVIDQNNDLLEHSWIERNQLYDSLP